MNCCKSKYIASNTKNTLKSDSNFSKNPKKKENKNKN